MKTRIYFVVLGLSAFYAGLLLFGSKAGDAASGDELRAAQLPIAPEREWAPPPAAIESALRPYLPPGDLPVIVPMVPSEKSLPPVQPALKLNAEKEAVITPAAADVPLLPPETPEQPLLPPVSEPEQLRQPKLLVEDVPPIMVEPLIPPARLIPDPPIMMLQPEEFTMKTVHLAATAVLIAALTSQQAVAAEPNDDVIKAIERLDNAVKQLQAVEKGLTEYKTVNANAMQQVQTSVESLKSRITALEEEVKSLRTTAAVPNDSTSKRDTLDTTKSTAKLRLSNDFLEAVSIMVNRQSFRLAPGQSRDIIIPAGPYEWQLLEFPGEGMRFREIRAGETKPIRIYTVN